MTFRDPARRRRMALVPGGRRARRRLLWARRIEVVLFATALLAVLRVMQHIDADREPSTIARRSPSDLFPLPRLGDLAAEVLVAADTHERSAAHAPAR
jgi:hypothetical protein